MEDKSNQERSFEATPRRLEQLRKEGQILRSRDLVSLLILTAGAIGILILGEGLSHAVMEFIQAAFILTQDNLLHFDKLFTIFLIKGSKLLLYLLPLFILMFFAAMLSPFLLGGFIFTPKAFTPQLKRLNPLEGIKRVISIRSILELIKGSFKFLLIFTFGIAYLWSKKNILIHLNALPFEQAVSQALSILKTTFLILLGGLVVIALIDAPMEYFQFQRKTKMTLQEIKDEMKESEGRPEVKQRRQALARQAIRQRLAVDVPKASVIVTNPTYYAVALKYDAEHDRTPIVVAKGKNWVAQQIRELAELHNVPLYSAPPLARSIFHSTEVGQDIPAGLYMAVAVVLTYVYQLKKFQAREADRPAQTAHLPIPKELQYEGD